ncbi:MAG: hypothetical protein ACRD0G_02785 [Acidimicrobiales bacterium]
MFDEMFKRITPDGDFDGDGVSNRDEWAQGTDATDPSSGARVGREGVGSDVSVEADKTWNGKPGEDLPGRKLAEKKTPDDPSNDESDEEPDGWQPRVTIVEDSVEGAGYLLHHGSDDNYVALGAEGKASYEVGFEDGNATVEAEAGGFLGAIAKVRQQFEEGVVSGDAEATVSIGVEANASVKAEIGTDGAVVGGKVGAHAGGKAEVEASGEAMGVTVGGGVGVSYGLGAEVEGECEITFENVGCELEAGVTVGVGANAKGELGFSPKEFADDATELVEDYGPAALELLGGPVGSAASRLARLGEEDVPILDAVREQVIEGASEVHGSTTTDGSTDEQPGSSVWDVVAAPMREALEEAQSAMDASPGGSEYGMSMLDEVATHDPQIGICEPDSGTVDHS